MRDSCVVGWKGEDYWQVECGQDEELFGTKVTLAGE